MGSYRIQRREQGQGESDWVLVETTSETSVALNRQERGKTLEYRVIAKNKAGESAQSNTVTAVL
ncbi:MAG: hypothetical protein BECKG1743D_GA0114223_102871 [Candidatus Kentron sp. G]|nr:MAG: hypothetical protein BECKG1743F_GA0114225_103363 [Candidatus Kentron sp. G]VFM99814.1 MAG: hypothetical protein BECKG1743E_GA0114224_102834 [Candidatus Kentron sp. G]VFN01515.1 MAG: hypothetical protein BECKG1743D_GA0114223_102871 [Candidatus Kentron sp. G]